MSEVQFIPCSDASGFKLIAELADEIWREHYTPIIGPEQVEYMLVKFQSPEVMQEQLKENYRYFLIKAGEMPVGYFAVQVRDDKMFLSKLYILKARRGKGYAGKTMDFIKALAKEAAVKEIELTVNKKNTDSIEAYKKMGFSISAPVVFEIGNGYVMDDFIMRFKLNKVLS